MTADTEADLKKHNEMLKLLLMSSLQANLEQEKVGKVFHDFNNILSSLMGYSSLSVERTKSSGDEKLVRYVENIERAAIRARDLVREKLEERRTSRVSRICSISDVLSECLPQANFAAVQGNVYFEREMFEYLLALLVDSSGDGAAEVSVTSNYMQFGACSACGSEFSGEQLELTLSAEGIGRIMEADIRLAEAIIMASGGHLCSSLVQDGQIVIYLRSVPD